MKLALLASLISSAAAFAPASTGGMWMLMNWWKMDRLSMSIGSCAMQWKRFFEKGDQWFWNHWVGLAWVGLDKHDSLVKIEWTAGQCNSCLIVVGFETETLTREVSLEQKRKAILNANFWQSVKCVWLVLFFICSTEMVVPSGSPSIEVQVYSSLV